MPIEERSLRQILEEHFDLKGLSFERVAQITGIPDRYIRALLEGNTKSLPAAPYVHAYLKRLGAILDLDPQELIQIYDEESLPPRSGLADTLPQNRFAIVPPVKFVNKKTLAVAAIILALLLYLGWSASRLFGIPELTITSPQTDIVTVTSTIVLQGSVSRGDLLTINNNEVSVNPDGSFKKNYPLELGLNTIEFRAKRFLGRTAIVTRRILYEPQTSTTTQP